MLVEGVEHALALAARLPGAAHHRPEQLKLLPPIVTTASWE
jgi:hypothetical protein